MPDTAPPRRAPARPRNHPHHRADLSLRPSRPAPDRARHGRGAPRRASSRSRIPLVLQSLVDGPLSTGDGAQIWPAALIVLVLGVLEAGLILARRWFVLTPGTHVEATMRNTLYAKLQDLPVAFHDRWQSGQLLSRAMSDLGLIRRWLAFGIVLLVVNIATVADRLRRAVLLELDAGAGLPGLLDPALDLRVRLREQVLGRRPPVAGPAGRPGDRRRGVGARHPRAQGVRARAALAREVHPPGRGAARHRDREGARHRRHLAVAAAGARRRVRALPARRRVARVDRTR